MRNQIPIMEKLYYDLGTAGIAEYGVLVSGALGTRIKVPDVYKDVRPVTNVIEITVPSKDEDKVMEAVQRAGWIRDDVLNYFSITYRAADGEKVTIPTVVKQEFLYTEANNSRIYLAPIFTTAKFYQGHNNKLVVNELNLESDGEMLMRKIIRSDYRDEQDVAWVAVADDLAKLFGPQSMDLWLRTFPNKNDDRIRQRVMPILNMVEAVKGNGRISDLERIMNNLGVLRGLMRSDETEKPAEAEAQIKLN